MILPTLNFNLIFFDKLNDMPALLSSIDIIQQKISHQINILFCLVLKDFC